MHKFSTAGWNLLYQLSPRSGIVLQEVMHNNYNFALDMRVVRVWINPSEPWNSFPLSGVISVVKGEKNVTGEGTSFLTDLRIGQQIASDKQAGDFYSIASIESDTRLTLSSAALRSTTGGYVHRERRYFFLGNEDFFVTRANGNCVKSPEVQPLPAPFDKYNRTGDSSPYNKGLFASYKSRQKVFGDNNDIDDDYLHLEQSYIFCPYSKDPPHEPSGGLSATRIFPVVKFSYKGKKVLSIRVDFRWQFSLDIFLKEVGAGNGLKKPMLAGVFRDKETSPGPGTNPSKIEDLFESFEKPLKFELFSFGLLRGLPGKFGVGGIPADKIIRGSDLIPSTWDNFHVWSNFGIQKDGKLLYAKPSPSTPGAFHAVHMHWRWGEVVQAPEFVDKIKVFFGSLFYSDSPSAGSLGEPQFKGLDKIGALSLAGVGGALVDPKIPYQTIRFAFSQEAKDNTRSVPSRSADANGSEQEYQKLFFDSDKSGSESPGPKNIEHGVELVTWYSVESFADKSATAGKKEFSGSVLVHGIYFPHEQEPSVGGRNSFAGTQGVDGQKYPYDPVKWTRMADGK
jgi:hypothetical protein